MKPIPTGADPVRMALRSILNSMCLGNRAACCRFPLHPPHAPVRRASCQPRSGFKPEKVAVVTKTTRFEFELQRYRYAGLAEEDLKQLVLF